MCLTPVTVKRAIAGHFYMNNVPCNHCLECVKDKQNEYIIRTIEEQRKRGSMVFFTLTYSPEALPTVDGYEIDEETGEMSVTGTQTLRRADVTLWLRLFRQKYKRKGIKLDFAHLICGEYGPKTLRPHYHGIILGLEREQVNELMWMWRQKYGFVVFNYIPSIMSEVEKVARYTAKYVCKNEDFNLLPSPECEKPRKMTSQFYGMPTEERWKGWIRYYLAQDIVDYDPQDPHFEDKTTYYRVVNEIIKRRKYHLGNGKQFKLPNYYKRKIFYYKDGDRERASKIQRMVTYNVQCNAYKDFKAEIHNLATLYDLRDYAQAVDKYNLVHADDLRHRAERYAESDKKYMVKSVY